MRKPSLIALVAIVLATLAAQSTVVAQSPDPQRTTTRKLALGVSMLPDADLATIDSFTASVGGRTPAIWMLWSDWGNPTTAAFPDRAFLDGLRARHAVPMITWCPLDPAHPDSDAYTYAKIAAGAWDAYIRGWATAAKAWGGTILLRWAHEMDGTWFPWSIGRFGNENTPARFVAAWRHIWNVIRGAGAKNVKFLWSPMVCRGCASLKSVYPGDKYVDYAGFTSFNWSTPNAWRSMDQLYGQVLSAMKRVTRKPVIVTETGSSPSGGDKAAWIRAGYPAVYKRFPQIVGIVYFNVDAATLARQPDWRLTTPSNALAAYRSLLTQAKFQGRLR